MEKIRALLGAEFIYEDEGSRCGASYYPRLNSIFPGRAPDAPRTDEIAARIGDFERITELVSEAALVYPKEAAKLGRLAEEFDSNTLLRLVQARTEGCN